MVINAVLYLSLSWVDEQPTQYSQEEKKRRAIMASIASEQPSSGVPRTSSAEALPRSSIISTQHTTRPLTPTGPKPALPRSTGGVTLNTGYLMPSLGLGTWGGGEPAENSAKAVTAALNMGYRLLDCAEAYHNESEIGVALEQAFCSDSLNISRKDVFLVSKVWNTNHASQHVREACLNTLKNLKTDYLDLYLIHWPIAFEYTGVGPGENIPNDALGHCKLANNISIYETWRAMEKLVEDGLVRSIGVSNFSSVQLADVLSYAKFPPAVNQVECHAYLPQENILKMCRSKSIILMAYAPLGRPGSVRVNKLGDVLIEDDIICEIAGKRASTPAIVLLRWNMQRGVVVIPKSTNEKRLAENFSSMVSHELQLTDKEMEQINGLAKNGGRRFRYCNYSWGVGGCNIFD